MEAKTSDVQPKVIIRISQLSYELLEKIALQVRATKGSKN